MKKVARVLSSPPMHWVGDGFPVRSIFNYDEHGALLSPFLLLDHTAPTRFEPADQPRGVGQHPHRGFETVSIVFDGELEHRDSSGGTGTIGAGDVQWMTAGSGVLHDEFHSQAFTRRGGLMEGVQLWVNLPAKDKFATPRYQTLLSNDIPVVDLPMGAGTVRVIAGQYAEVVGPASTFSPLNVWDLRLQARHSAEFSFEPGHTVALAVLKGAIAVDGEGHRAGQLVVFERQGREIRVDAVGFAKVLVLSGEPIDEPIVGYGPFVMNSERQIREAIHDFNSGAFGRLSSRPRMSPAKAPDELDQATGRA